MNNENKRVIFDQGNFSEAIYPFLIKPNFSTLGSITEISTHGPLISFLPDDSMRDLPGFKRITIYEEFNLSPKPVDLLSFDNMFPDCDIAQSMIFRGQRIGIIHNWTRTVSLGYKFLENSSGGFSWYMMESKDKISSVCFKLKIENNQLVSFNGKSITFRLSIKKKLVFNKINAQDIEKLGLHFNKQKPNETKSNLLPNQQPFKQSLMSGNGLLV